MSFKNELSALINKWFGASAKSAGNPLDSTTIPNIPLPAEAITSGPDEDPHGRARCAYVEWARETANGTTGTGAAAAKAFAASLPATNFIQLEVLDESYPDMTDAQKADVNAGATSATLLSMNGAVTNLWPAQKVIVVNGRNQFVAIEDNGGIAFPQGTALADVPSKLMDALKSDIRKGTYVSAK